MIHYGSYYINGSGPCITNVFCDTSQEFQPMASQLSKKAALPLAKILATCRNNVSNTGPRYLIHPTCHLISPADAE